MAHLSKEDKNECFISQITPIRATNLKHFHCTPGRTPNGFRDSQKEPLSPADKSKQRIMRKLKLFSTPKFAFPGQELSRGQIDIKIETEKNPKPRLNLSIISSDDEFISCDEMGQSKENLAHVTKETDNKSCEHLKATKRLSQVLNSLSISNYAEYENRIQQLEKENLSLQSRILELERDPKESKQSSELDSRNKNKINKLLRKEEKYRAQINLLIERVEYLNGHTQDLKTQCKRYKSDRDLYKSQLNSYRDEKIKLEKQIWELESQLDAEQFKIDKAELRIEQMKRELSYQDLNNRTGSSNYE